MVIYNMNIMFVMNCKNVNSYRLSMASLVFYATLFYLLVMLPKNQGMWDRFLLFLLCQHSYWPNIWSHVLAAFSALYPCDLGVAVFPLCLAVLQVLFFCLSLHLHLWFWSHPRMASMVAFPSYLSFCWWPMTEDEFWQHACVPIISSCCSYFFCFNVV